MAKTGKIHHPTDKYKLHSAHFAASGTAENVQNVKGTLIDQTTGEKYDGRTLLNPKDSHSGKFWIIHFVYDLSSDHKYTLKTLDADYDALLAESNDISVLPPTFGIGISYPQPSESVSCGEFAPYGTSSSIGGTMQGSLGCAPTAQIAQSSGPPDWVLYIYSNAPPGDCTLIVSQTGGTPVPPSQSVTFTCGTT